MILPNSTPNQPQGPRNPTLKNIATAVSDAKTLARNIFREVPFAGVVTNVNDPNQRDLDSFAKLNINPTLHYLFREIIKGKYDLDRDIDIITAKIPVLGNDPIIYYQVLEAYKNVYDYFNILLSVYKDDMDKIDTIQDSIFSLSQEVQDAFRKNPNPIPPQQSYLADSIQVWRNSLESSSNRLIAYFRKQRGQGSRQQPQQPSQNPQPQPPQPQPQPPQPSQNPQPQPPQPQPQPPQPSPQPQPSQNPNGRGLSQLFDRIKRRRGDQTGRNAPDIF